MVRVVWFSVWMVLGDMPDPAQLQKARVQYEQARAAGDASLQTCEELGSVYDMLHAYREAVALYTQCLITYPDHTALAHERALTWLLLGDTQQALEALKVLLHQHPKDTQLQEDLGYAYLQNKNYAEAGKHFQQVVKMEPLRVSSWYFLAQAYVGEKKYPEALRCVEKALATDPAHPEALRMRQKLQQVLKNL